MRNGILKAITRMERDSGVINRPTESLDQPAGIETLGLPPTAQEGVNLQETGANMLSDNELKSLENQVYEPEKGPKYFAEAMTNFRSGSYRSCVLMLSNAVFSHAYQKLKHAASVDPIYQKPLKDVDDKKASGDAFEARLASCIGGTDLVDEEVTAYLEELRKFRNRSAHPGGKNIRDSETAYLLKMGVKLVLSQATLDPRVTVEEIVLRVREADYFPRRDRGSMLDLVKTEVALLPTAAYQRLVERVVKLLIADDDIAHENAIDFLCSCAELGDTALDAALARKAVLSNLKKTPSQNDMFTLMTLRIIDRSSGCLAYLKEEERARLDVRLADFFRSYKPVHHHLHRAEGAVLKLTTEGANGASRFSDLHGVLRSSLSLGFVLLGNEGVPKSVRQLVNTNLRAAARTWGSEKHAMLSFFEAVGNELPGRMTEEEAYHLWATLESRRIGGPNNKNYTRVGACRTAPELMKFSDEEGVLMRLEQLLREKVQAAFRARPDAMSAHSRRSKLPLPPGCNEFDVSPSLRTG